MVDHSWRAVRSAYGAAQEAGQCGQDLRMLAQVCLPGPKQGPTLSLIPQACHATFKDVTCGVWS
eukprot:1678752-Prorocentrum_lima.AAC.1